METPGSTASSAPLQIFLSYARDDDEPFVWRLYGGLKNAGFEVWFDRVSMPARTLTFHRKSATPLPRATAWCWWSARRRSPPSTSFRNGTSRSAKQ